MLHHLFLVLCVIFLKFQCYEQLSTKRFLSISVTNQILMPTTDYSSNVKNILWILPKLLFKNQVKIRNSNIDDFDDNNIFHSEASIQNPEFLSQYSVSKIENVIFSLKTSRTFLKLLKRRRFSDEDSISSEIIDNILVQTDFAEQELFNLLNIDMDINTTPIDTLQRYLGNGNDIHDDSTSDTIDKIEFAPSPPSSGSLASLDFEEVDLGEAAGGVVVVEAFIASDGADDSEDSANRKTRTKKRRIRCEEEDDDDSGVEYGEGLDEERKFFQTSCLDVEASAGDVHSDEDSAKFIADRNPSFFQSNEDASTAQSAQGEEEQGRKREEEEAEEGDGIMVDESSSSLELDGETYLSDLKVFTRVISKQQKQKHNSKRSITSVSSAVPTSFWSASKETIEIEFSSKENTREDDVKADNK